MVATLATVLAILGVGLVAAPVAIRTAAHTFSANTAACSGLGHASRETLRLNWEGQTITDSSYSTDFTVSNVITIPSGSQGMHVGAIVYGSRNAPIFPDPVELSVVADARLTTALRQDADRRRQPSSTSSKDPSLLVTVGFGIKAINRDVALPPGTYRLVSADDASRIGSVDIRICS